MTFGSLFAGIGGMDLGLERSGMQCSWQVEIDPYARRVLEKHWPGVRRHDDVRTFPPTDAEEWQVDLIAGGFPCQDISNAGERAGIDGERSGLWREYARIVRVLRPCFVLVENVSALLGRGLGRVLGDLAACGYDAEWEILSACMFGAPHARERVFLIAHDSQGGGNRVCVFGEINAEGVPKSKWLQRIGRSFSSRKRRNVKASDFGRLSKSDGFSKRLGEIAGYGNAVVPQIAEWIGRRIVEAAQ